MDNKLRNDADEIIRACLNAVLPDNAVVRALGSLKRTEGKIILVAAGKAAWQMANAAVNELGKVDDGIVVTKYEHVMGEIPGVACYEAGHPVPDENSFIAASKALELVGSLTEKDTILFLSSVRKYLWMMTSMDIYISTSMVPSESKATV